jgi:toluene monooxygenase electron transfer component
MAEFFFETESSPAFLPGQFVLASLPGVVGDRAYSMSNPPQQDGNWQFIVKNMPGGAGSDYLFNRLKKGDVLPMDGPFGHAYLREDNDRGVVLVAGGSGLSPVVSILRSMAANPAFTDRPVHLFHGGRGPSDLCTASIIDQLNDPTISISCHEAISDPNQAQDWDGRCCFVHELLPEVLGEDFAEFDYYFCGPPPMTEAVQRMVMVDYQVPFEQVHFDRFF